MKKSQVVVRVMSLFGVVVLASASALAAGPTFAVTMKLTGANLGTSINADTLEVGMSAISTDGVDANNVDIPVAPGSPQAAVTVQFTNASLPPDISGLITDMRLQGTSKTWALVVAGMPSSGSPTIIIDWNTSGIYGFDPSVAALAGYNLLFKGNGADVNMKTTLTTTITRSGTYSIALTQGANTNSAPIAISDSTSTLKGTARIINVLANDSDPDGNALNVSLVTDKSPAHGNAVVNGDKTITYTPTAGYTGPDSFDYMITDVPAAGAGAALTATATVTVDVNNKFVITRSFPKASTKPGSTFTVNLLVAYANTPAGLKIEEDLPVTAETETVWTQTGAITFKDSAGAAYVPAGLTVTPVQVGNVITFTYSGTFPTSNPFTMVYQVTVPGDAISSNNPRTFTGHFAEDTAPAAPFDGEIPATNMTVCNRPTATLAGVPPVATTLKTANLTVGGTNVTAYKWKLDTGNWSAETPVATHINLSNLADGLHWVFIVGRNADSIWQLDEEATMACWRVYTVSAGGMAWGDNSVGQCTPPPDLTGMVGIAAGYFHTVALKSDGTVVTWGNDSYGASTVPTNLTGVVAVAAGGYRTVALKSDGTVVSWGDNFYGASTVPTGLTGVVAVAAGVYHTVALKSDGTVVAWGDNSAGACIVPAGLTGVVAIAAGSYHTIALKSDGTVITWGFDNSGQCTVPTDLTGVVAVAAGVYHTVALKSDGTLIAWGDNNYGQCTVPTGLTGVVAVAAGFHTVALKSDGTVVSWGNNSSGASTVPTGLTGVVAVAAGPGHTVALLQSKLPATVTLTNPTNSYTGNPIPATSTTTPANLAVTYTYNGSSIPPTGRGSYTVVATINDWTYAGSTTGSLLINKATPAITWPNPVDIVYGTALSTTQLNATCGVPGTFAYNPVAGTVLNAGDSQVLGVTFNPTDTTNYSSASATVTFTVTKASQTIDFAALANETYGDLPIHVSATASSGLAVTFSVADGPASFNGNTLTLTGAGTVTVRALQAGNSNWTPAPNVDRSFVVGKASQTITFTTLPFRTAGDLDFAPGAIASSGLTVSYTTSNPAVATIVNGLLHPVGPGTSFISASQTGDSNWFAAPSVGRVLRVLAPPSAGGLAWGDNSHGQRTAPLGLTAVSTVAAGSAHTLTLKADGTVVAWGDNYYGECMVPAGLTDVVAIVAGDANSVALKHDGTVVAWGDNSAGQNSVPEGLTDVVAVAAGGYHTVALKSDGTVVTWGDNSAGACTVPAGLTGVVAIAAGFGHSVAVKNDATVVAWGDNGSGQCTVPTNLAGVVAVAAGFGHTVAQKANGTVVAWGDNAYNECNVPVGLTRVATISACPTSVHTAAIKTDGTVVAWGYNGSGQCTVPAGLTGVAGVAAGGAHSVALLQTKLPATVTLTNPTNSYTGNPIPATSTTTPAGLAVTCTYSGSPNPPSDTGGYTVVATINDWTYAGSTSGSMSISKTLPVITWANPSDIVYGTALSSTQLNATSGGVAGSFVYTPATGTVLDAGASQTLSATFTPIDTVTYASTSKSVVISVTKTALTVTANNASRAYGAANPTFTASYQGLITGDDESKLGGALQFDCAANAASAMGNYLITPRGLTSTNYTLNYAAGTLTVIKTTPDAFSFTDVTGMELGAVLTSNVITVGSINAAAGISVTGGEYAVSTNSGISWSAFSTSVPASVNNGDQVKLRTTTSANFITAVNVALTIGGISDTWTVTTRLPAVTGTQSGPTGGYRAGTDITISSSFAYPGDHTMLSLLCRPQLPSGWTLKSVAGSGTPELQNGEIVFIGSLTTNPLAFSYVVTVPAGASGAQELRATVEYTLSGMVNSATVMAGPNPLVLNPVQYHTADYRDTRWVIDGTEINRVLAYWRAGGYHADVAGLDGYAASAGATTGANHSADYRDNRWVIDGTEVNRVLAYWRAGGYHADAVGLDGYAAGLTVGRGEASSRTAPIATHQLQGGGSTYFPSTTVTVTGTFEYTGTMLSLLWRPNLPSGWTLGAVTGDGTLEKIGGECVWTGSLPASPVHISYSVTIPAGAAATAQIRDEVEYQLTGQVNPSSVWAGTDPLALTKYDPNAPWNFTFSLANADKAQLVIGMNPLATDGYDAAYDLDSPEPPMSASTVGGAYFVDAQEFLYQRDVRATADAAAWLLEVVANQQPVTVAWSAGQVPVGKYLHVQQVTAAVAGQSVANSDRDLSAAGNLVVPALTTRWFVIEFTSLAEPFVLNLTAGWNLISLPLEPDNPLVSAIFSNGRGDVSGLTDGSGQVAMSDGRRGSVTAGAVWSWVPGSGGHYQAVTELHALNAYWVFLTAPAQLTIPGRTMPGRVVLQPGWNLFGPGADVPMPASADLQGNLWWWDTTTSMYALQGNGANLVRGRGYWVFAKAAVELEY